VDSHQEVNSRNPKFRSPWDNVDQARAASREVVALKQVGESTRQGRDGHIEGAYWGVKRDRQGLPDALVNFAVVLWDSRDDDWDAVQGRGGRGKPRRGLFASDRDGEGAGFGGDGRRGDVPSEWGIERRAV
jgi:hypothetical protein